MKRLLSALCVVVILAAHVGQAAPRKVLCELITSTTCAPCYNPDVFFFYQWLPNYGGQDMIIPLAYHVWWPSPGNDPMYLANPQPVQVRNSYYQATGGYAPRMFIDGFVDGTSNYPSWPGAIEPRFLDPSPISITLTGTRTGSTLDLNARIYAESPVNSSNWRLHWVVVESELSYPQNSGSGYVPFVHHAVHRNMYPDANGSAISITQGQTVDVPRSITLNSAWVAENCKVIVFVQDNGNRKVQNAEVLEVATLTSVGPGGEETPAAFALAQNFPNPFNPTTTILYDVTEASFVSIKVVNTLGQEVKTLVAGEVTPGFHRVEWDGTDINGSDVPSGVYFYTMQAGTFRATKKLMLLK